MLRTLVLLLVLLAAITLLRNVVGLIARAVNLFLSEPSSSGSRSQTQAPTSGELRKDPVCGTFVSTGTSVKRTVRGETVHFCSAACRDRYQA